MRLAHGFYEQERLTHNGPATPYGAARIMGIHESPQSRLWEILTGQSLPFWEGQTMTEFISYFQHPTIIRTGLSSAMSTSKSSLVSSPNLILLHIIYILLFAMNVKRHYFLKSLMSLIYLNSGIKK